MLHFSARRWRVLPAATILALLGFAGVAHASTDLALNHPAVASSTFSTSYPASNAVDGNTATRWAAAANKTPDTLQVDLGASTSVGEVSIQWGTDYPTRYLVQTSEDATTWTTIYSTTTGNGGTDDLTGLTGTGRYVHVVGQNQNDTWGNSIYNLSVYSGTTATVPTNTSPPVLSGTPQQGQTLSLTSGTWNDGGSPITSYSYGFQRCPDAACTAPTNIAPFSSTVTTYTVQSADVGSYLRGAVVANNAAGSSQGATSSTLGPVTATTPPPPSGAVVAANPTGPNTPAGGWNVAYANAFGGCAPGMTCQVSGAPDDNTVTLSSGKPSNSNEPTWYVPAQNVVEADGLHQRVTYQAGISTGKNYAAAELTTNGTGQMHFDPGQGQTWVFEMVAKLPPTTGEEDPAYWMTCANWSCEIDTPEFWGWHAGSGGKDWTSSNGDGMGFPAVPRSNGSGSASGESAFYWNGSQLTYAPDAAFHTYTVEMIGTTFYSWLDGKPMTVGRTIGSVGGWSKQMGKLILQHSLRDPTTGNPSPYFLSGSRDFTVRSIALYEDAASHYANTQNAPVVAPGTSVQ